ncbi:glutaredoxin family protein [Paenibacillus macquariensis]|uniref:Glutaredoxin n=1 Tax=Paenibacillus macquariensis TaxID=948756 RepID=A0ABY1KA65_9BACL|nr:glutaredoxin family protein [Paenibacillus macquariensis]MEC0092351.1 glutaredoxin family protein [Paenibacillus macquariensis]OAB35327.1 NrdH-redoxin [Paenibacillus macquariensis subsp. macquariensis]SIR48553.1 Glutaredoxin [Paenibacillus macquariensis]
MSTNPKIIVWSKPGCHYCSEVKTYLEANDYSYENINVEGNDILRDVLEVKYGVRHVPVVEIDNDGKFEGVTEVGLEHLQTVLTSHLIS